MTCWAVIPIKAADACKTRLADMLSPDGRQALVRRMVAHVVATAEAAAGVDAVMLLGPSRHDLRASLPLLADAGGGLNRALGGAVEAASQAGVDRLVILPGDLPLLTGGDVERLAALEEGQVAVAPDRAGSGTNALSLPLPAAREFRFGFGDGSFAHHCAEAGRLGLALSLVRSETLGFDVDEPADLAALEERAT